jgi:hypothetical protein
MDSITLTFLQPLNASVQIGDTVYYTNDINGKDIKVIGLITALTATSITAEISASQIRPVLTSFILFSKTAKVNTSNLKGYYAEMQFMNDSEDYSELFLVGSQVFESSK